MFKLLMQKSVIDTRETGKVMRNNLSSLDTYMSTMKSDASRFNKYFKLNLTGIQAAGIGQMT